MAAAAEAKIKELEEEYARTQKNKATNGHLGLIKAKIAKLRREILDANTTAPGAGGGGIFLLLSDDVSPRRHGAPIAFEELLLDGLFRSLHIRVRLLRVRMRVKE